MLASDDKFGSTCTFVKPKDEHDVHKANHASHYFEFVLLPENTKIEDVHNYASKLKKYCENAHMSFCKKLQKELPYKHNEFKNLFRNLN